MSRIPFKIAAVCFITVLVAVLIASQGTLILVAFASAIASCLVVYVAAEIFIASRLRKVDSLIAEIQDTGQDSLIESSQGDEIDLLMKRVNEVSDSVKTQLSALQRMESYRKDFLGDISHELKTPIFAVRGFAETLIDGAMDDPEVRVSFLEKIVQNADRLGSLAEDLNAITRIETGELKMEMTPFNIGSVVKDVISQLEPMAVGEQVALTHRIGPIEKFVYGDPVRIHQVIRNLAENAIKYTEAGGFTEIVVRKIGPETVRISVVDNGIGILPVHIERITERFFRVERSRARGFGGTGLGLAIVKHILAAHGQKLMVESSVNVGSTFAFDISFADKDSVKT